MEKLREISLRERIRLNLVSAMEKANINQVQLADRLGISKGTVNNWVRGNNSPDVDMVPQICKVLSISVLDLYSPTKYEAPTETENSPSADVSTPEEKISKIFDKLNQMLVSEGFVRDGSDLTEKQADILIAVCKIIDATFKD